MRRPTAGVTFLLVAQLTLAGCGKKPRPAPAPEPEAVAPAPVVTPPPGGQATPPALPPAPDTTPAASPIPPFVAYGPQPTPTPAPLPVAPMPAVPGAGVAAQPPQPPPAFPPPPPDMKEKDKGGASTSIKPEWPKSINGRTLPDYIRDTKDLDPAVRERSLRMIPSFGPELVRKEPGWPKAVLDRMTKDKEYDPGVRAAAYEAVGAVGMEKDADIKEAVRILFIVAEQSASGGGARLHAIQTLSVFGSKAEGAINYLIGPPMLDAAYETRRSVAFTLGRISMNDHAGPNNRSLEALFKLAGDHSAPVRMEAYQSIVILGPPLLPRPASAPLIKDLKGEVPKSDEKAVAVYAGMIKKRLAPAPPPKAGETPSPTGLVERDKQVEIMARLVLMRFDTKEPSDEHLSAIAKYVNDTEVGPRLQALNVLGLLGQNGAKKIDDVVRALTAEESDVVVAAVTTLVQFGPVSKAAIPAVERLRTRGATKEEKEYWQKLTDDAVKAIRDTEKKDKKP
jgi:HEAT repeat protein